ncbi:hypothetical protein MKX03_031466 [Papaver bracteatum]|nr:hypothetical protein MKX03_031466 [Papaver bracteatum]
MALTYFFVTIFFTFLKIVTGQKMCPSVRCSDVRNEPDIFYPFGIKDLQGVGCGYSGFNLTCNTFEKTVLKLPQSGEFLVRKIDYVNKEIRLYDQNNCLARRLQQKKLNVNLLPFKAYASQIYNFFNCPPSITSNISSLKGSPTPVSCLSTATNTVLVAIGASVTIPIPFSAVTKISSYDFTTHDLYLTWVEPKNPDDSKIDNDKEGMRVFIITMSVFIGIVLIASIVCCCRSVYNRGGN